MKIFISWSGKDSISKKVAIELSNWLPMIIQSIEPWVSTDITAGERWNETINKNLSESVMGIICISKENINSPWLNFEAGAIAKGISNNKVIPLLINLKPSDLINSPLVQFQAKSLEKSSIQELLNDINNTSDKSIAQETLNKLFERCWDEFYQTIERILSAAPIKKIAGEKSSRSSEEILEEVLSLTRDIKSDLSYRVGRLEQLIELTNRENYSFEEIRNLNNNNLNRNIRKKSWTVNEKNERINAEIAKMMEEKLDFSTVIDHLSNMFGIPPKVAMDYLNDFINYNANINIVSTK